MNPNFCITIALNELEQSKYNLLENAKSILREEGSILTDLVNRSIDFHLDQIETAQNILLISLVENLADSSQFFLS